MTYYTKTRSRRNVKPCPSLFDWQRNTELLRLPAVRSIARRSNVSPSTALAIAELAGLIREAR